MALTDDMSSNMDDMSDDMRDRYEELKSREASGELDDEGRSELQQLRNRFGVQE